MMAEAHIAHLRDVVERMNVMPNGAAEPVSLVALARVLLEFDASDEQKLEMLLKLMLPAPF